MQKLTTDKELLKRCFQKQVDLLYEEARRNDPLFCELVLKDEETGARIATQPFQARWHRIIDKYKHAVIWACPDCGKTQQLAIGRILSRLGRDNRKRFAVLSATHDQSRKIIRAIKVHVEENDVLERIWPRLKRGRLWADTAIEVDRPGGIKDPSVQAYSPEGGTIQGSRLDGLVIDDILTENNTRTDYQRQKLYEWVLASAFSRLSEDAWVVFLTNAWHPKDMAHRLVESGWYGKRFPVYNVDKKPLWPDRWPQQRIDNTRKLLGPLEFARQMLCEPRDDATARFKSEWIDICLQRGEGYKTYKSLEDIYEGDTELAEEMSLTESVLRLGGMPEGFSTITGVDLAISKKTSADRTAIFTIMVWPDEQNTRQVLEVQAGRWGGPEIINRLVSVHERFRSTVVVENNAAQDFILQWAREQAPGMRIQSFTTGRNKLSPEYGVESLAAELAAGMWLIPCQVGTRRTIPEITEWISELLHYDPRAHTGDILMASWIAREYARLMNRVMRARSRSGGVTVIG